jgi:hypothetical protein
MKRVFFFIMMLMFAVSVSAELNHYYKLDLIYQKGNISQTNLGVEPSSKLLKNSGSDYIAEVLSVDNKILNFTFFAIPFSIFYETFDPETGLINGNDEVILDLAQTTVFLPYYIDAKEINIYDSNLVNRLSIDVSAYSKVQGPKKTLKKKIGEPVEIISGLEGIAKFEIEKPARKTSAKIATGVLIGMAAILLLILLIIFIKKSKKR